MRMVYLDCAATTPVDQRVVEAMKPYFSKRFGNPSSLHTFGREARIGIDRARKQVAQLINAEPDEIVFTSGGTESDNLAIKGIAFLKKRGHIITSSIEHHAVLETCNFLEKNGFGVTYLPVDRYGIVSPADVDRAIRKDTILVSIMHANNEIGTIEPIEEIAKICKRRGVIFHTDAVQSFGKITVDVKKIGADLLSASSHKIYGPKGVGCLYVRKGIKLAPMLHGGHQEFEIRAGTENVPGIVGFGKACQIAKEEMVAENKRQQQLREKLAKGVLGITEAWQNGHPTKSIPGIANFCFKYLEGEAMLIKLDMAGIAVSTGSACAAKELTPSHVLTSLGLSRVDAHGSLRFSLGRHTTANDIDYVLKVLPKIIGELREISPLGRK